MQLYKSKIFKTSFWKKLIYNFVQQYCYYWKTWRLSQFTFLKKLTFYVEYVVIKKYKLCSNVSLGNILHCTENRVAIGWNRSCVPGIVGTSCTGTVLIDRSEIQPELGFLEVELARATKHQSTPKPQHQHGLDFIPKENTHISFGGWGLQNWITGKKLIIQTRTFMYYLLDYLHWKLNWPDIGYKQMKSRSGGYGTFWPPGSLRPKSSENHTFARRLFCCC